MELDEKYRICCEALGDFVVQAGFSDVIIGLSGGLDSAVVATMAADALGAEHVFGLLMPGPYSSDHSLRDARELADRLQIQTAEISITPPFEAFAAQLDGVFGGTLDGLAAENTQARCRMIYLMALSNARGWLLLNTGNKSEAMMGYSTLYGDTAGAFAPIGGLYKTDVFAVARWRDEEALRAGLTPPIPEEVLLKPPSAELSPEQTDEASLGLDYVTLDAILIGIYEEGLSDGELVARGFSAEAVADVRRRAASYAYKRALEPLFPQAAFYD